MHHGGTETIWPSSLFDVQNRTYAATCCAMNGTKVRAVVNTPYTTFLVESYKSTKTLFSLTASVDHSRIDENSPVRARGDQQQVPKLGNPQVIRHSTEMRLQAQTRTLPIAIDSSRTPTCLKKVGLGERLTRRTRQGIYLYMRNR